MAKKYESIFGEVDNKYYKRDIYEILGTIMMIVSILFFPFVIAGVVYGVYYKKTFILVLSIIIVSILAIWFIYAIIMSYLTHKNGRLTQASVVKVHGHYITYEYTNEKGKIIRSRAQLLKDTIVGITSGSPINIKVYKGRSCIVSEF